MTAPSEKAPGPDGYIGGFFKMAWDIIKHDLVAAVQDIFECRAGCWNLLNSANITLIPKREEATTVGDYRPISLMHSIAKILGKILANRLEPHLDSLVSHSQSAFIKVDVSKTTSNMYMEQSNIFTNPRRRCCCSNLTLPKPSTVCVGNIFWR